jgi:hypothetical protein
LHGLVIEGAWGAPRFSERPVVLLGARKPAVNKRGDLREGRRVMECHAGRRSWPAVGDCRHRPGPADLVERDDLGGG